MENAGERDVPVIIASLLLLQSFNTVRSIEGRRFRSLGKASQRLASSDILDRQKVSVKPVDGDSWPQLIAWLSSESMTTDSQPLIEFGDN